MHAFVSILLASAVAVNGLPTNMRATDIDRRAGFGGFFGGGLFGKARGGARAGVNAASANGAQPVQLQSVNQFTQPAIFAKIPYCKNKGKGQSLGGLNVLDKGGDGGRIPVWIVGASDERQEIVVSHEGTEITNAASLANDVQVQLQPLDAKIAGAANNDKALVHTGFQQTWLRSVDEVEAAVKKAMASTGFTKVLMTGHSLGAAISSIEAVYLKSVLPADTTMETVVFGLPRVGNAGWADVVDANLGDTFSHVVHFNDPVPSLPPPALGYEHPGGEVFLNSFAGNTAVSCPGRENANCALSQQRKNAISHLGPYAKVQIGSPIC